MLYDYTKNYVPLLDLMETQKAIKLVKDNFEKKLAERLDLTRVTAPLVVYEKSGLNDHLSGVERPVSFELKATGEIVEIVQSLAKWKRMALGKYDFRPRYGLYTDMNAIRKDEELDNLHSLYVDQWDWEQCIFESDRNLDYLQKIVRKIVSAIAETKDMVNQAFPKLKLNFSKDVFFITAQELQRLYPDLSPKERENAIARVHKTVFIIGIGWPLGDGKPHDLRAPDYDDWNLNGDILIWYEPLNTAIELSSMGIRVDATSLTKQLEATNTTSRLKFSFHQNISNNKLPFSIGGGIGQSRLCLVMLEKCHIGEVQASLWEDEDLKELERLGIPIL
ncbi:MAG TPA: aspartate--ammonia ligase [Acholeplasmataceae bacterium]|jgi:aspartate--ammonia ligase|nr:aspartate--ammonia ligase [Acholeplasmataceae bacterium]